jgi:hypothetical protein
MADHMSDDLPAKASPGSDPSTGDYAPTALPTTGARVAAFAAIVLAGLCGGVIGYAFMDLQTEGDSMLLPGIGLVVGALTGAVGVAVVATLALRAMGEWRTIQHREEIAERAPGNGAGARRPT